jgi:hypothetical protein
MVAAGTGVIGAAGGGVAGVIGTSPRAQARAAAIRLIHTSNTLRRMRESFLPIEQY